MLLWRLSGLHHANSFDGGYGFLFDGRWNTIGRAVTYCSTSPSLCVLEKLVHIEDPVLLPKLVMVTYDVPDTVDVETIALTALPHRWQKRDGFTQQIGDDWHRRRATLLLRAPSAIAAFPASPDVNIVINHTHPGSAEIKMVSQQDFKFDQRLL